jgi:hypothetical protein
LIDWIGKVRDCAFLRIRKKRETDYWWGVFWVSGCLRYCAVEYVKNGCTTSGPGCRELLGSAFTRRIVITSGFRTLRWLVRAVSRKMRL